MDFHPSPSDPVPLTRRSHGARTPGRFRRRTSAALHCPRITKFLVQLISRTDGASFFVLGVSFVELLDSPEVRSGEAADARKLSPEILGEILNYRTSPRLALAAVDR
jgi:hypothetical protein